MNKTITVQSRKFNGAIYRKWNCEFIEQKDNLLVFVGSFEKEIVHPELGIIRPGTVSYEYYWLDRWYNVFRFHEPDGLFKYFYCNINSPPIFQFGILDYIDYDIDVLITKDWNIKILDLEEFETNSRVYKYSEMLKENINSGLSEVLNLAKKRDFPFDVVNL